MIPKKIHYIWVGKNPLNDFTLKCIESWKKHCPEYEIIEWNESNFNINSNLFCSEAYQSKKWAFCSDYIRLNILYNHGGIYLDTDVELIVSLDKFLHLPAFIGFEDTRVFSTAVIGASKSNLWIKEQLSYYGTRKFIKPNGKFDTTTNPVIISKRTKKLYPNFQHNNTEQHFDNLSVFPREYFSPINVDTKALKITKNTHAIHHFDGSWIVNNTLKRKIISIYKKIVGEKVATFVRRLRDGV